MKFLTDEQTIEDLRLFSKHDVPGIYDIYNHTCTRGGEQVLEGMFRHPLTSANDIGQRSGIIAAFAKLNLAFPFEAATFDVAEKYLAGLHSNTRRAVLNENDIAHGVAAVIQLLLQTHHFIQGSTITAIAAYAPERAAIADLLAATALVPALREKHPQKISFAAVTAYDQLFRGVEGKRIIQLLKSLYQLDVYLSVAKIAGQRGFVFPTALEKGPAHLKLEGVYHPSLSAPVSNTVNVDNKSHVIFLTGANMAGKSTFLRSVSTALYIAHMGFPVAAKAMEFAVLDGIYTTINLPDNLGIGASHFYAEVLRLKKVSTALGEGKALLVIFDELFRGTNVKDAHEASVAVTKAFARKQQSLFIVSSHIVEAGADLHNVPGVAFYYLPTRMKGNTPKYTYTLEKGITDDRHGMLIIRNEGVLDILKAGLKPGAAIMKAKQIQA